jgi:hypothetical protein
MVERGAVAVTTGGSDEAVTTTVTVDDGGRVTVGGVVGADGPELAGSAVEDAVVATGAEEALFGTGFDSVTAVDRVARFELAVADPAAVRAAVVTCAACPSTSDEQPAMSTTPTATSRPPDQRRPGRYEHREVGRLDADRSVFMIPRR